MEKMVGSGGAQSLFKTMRYLLTAGRGKRTSILKKKGREEELCEGGGSVFMHERFKFLGLP